jgi:predicted nucleic acid-binding protein
MVRCATGWHLQAAPLHALWTDAYLASFASANQAQMVTFDQGLRRFLA